MTALAPITYIGPWERATWDRIIAARPQWVPINPDSGPGVTPDPAYVDLVLRLQAHGIAVLGYVHTSWGNRPVQLVEAEMSWYRSWYGIDGALIDEVSPDLIKYLMVLNGRAASFTNPRLGGKGLAVFNPGVAVPPRVMQATGRSLWCLAEGPAAGYVPGARSQYPERELHIVHSAPDPTSALALIASGGIGYGFATGDDGANPYDTFPRYRVDEYLPILGLPLVTGDQAVAAFTSRNPARADIPLVIDAYANLCEPVGLSLAAALGQMAHETGWLKSWWSHEPRQNYAGVGVTGATYATQPKIPASFDPSIGKWRAGLSFPTIGEAVVGHVGRLLGYVLAPGAGTTAQQALIARALALRPLPAVVRGSAQRLRELGQVHNPSGSGWAMPGTAYGAGIAKAINAIIAT